MGPHKFDIHGTPAIVHRTYNPVVIAFHIEYDPILAHKRN
jgi:hypothetical protein